MSDCLFCRIINKEINSSVVFEDERVLAIHDVNPLAPVHILLMPKKHVANLEDVDESDIDLLGYIQYRAREIARQQGLNGHYRIMNNCGEKGGQRIFHLHYHLLGGTEFE
ncbi:MAG: histidine triad nucleotide-binding protein [Ignavibacteriales bacterium]